MRCVPAAKLAGRTERARENEEADDIERSAAREILSLPTAVRSAISMVQLRLISDALAISVLQTAMIALSLAIGGQRMGQ